MPQGVKLTYLSWSMLPCEAANGLQTVKMCEGFSRVGAQVELINPAFAHNPVGTPESLWDYYHVPRDCFVHHPMRTLAYALGQASVIGQSRGVNLTFSWAYSAHIRRHCHGPQQVVFTRQLDSVPRLAALRRRHGFRLVFEIHSFPTQDIEQRMAACAQADLVIAISSALAERCVAAGVPSERVLVEHDGFDPEDFAAAPTRDAARAALGFGPDELVVGYVGSFRHADGEKGIVTLVDALQPFVGQPVRLCLVGGPEEDAERLRLRAAELGLVPPQYDFRGRANREQLVRFLAAFDICVNPLPDTAHNRAASPLKLFEYMAAGGAIVATNLPGMAEVVEHERSALLVPPSDAAALSAALTRLRESPELRAGLGSQAKVDAAHYAWPARAERILARLFAVPPLG